ncbi:glycosyltransferase family 4 protein [Halobacterium salinarum]|uniref:glycosyltransferase family 4 protein n=1 Tax=Halobacterium salinarum TaxID=2242 RepID=UPI002555636C|nr:glycosyltransferase family 4 protein [Halobacterium salinarum]MDL0131626.1 glycosyltransferase family 4 protein [Halobacterium salinarum]
MNIAFAAPVVYPYVKGGVEKRTYEVGRRLVDRGHDVTIYSRHWWNGPRSKTQAGMKLQAVGPPSELYADGDRRSVLSALGLAGRLVKPLAQAKHDLVVTPVAPYFHVFAVRLSSALQRTPLVVTWHEVWDDYWHQYMGRIGSVGKAVERITAQIPQHVVVPSQMTAGKFQKLAPRQTVEVIPNGIDVSEVASVPPMENGYDILYVGRLIEDKNVSLLIEAFEQCDSEARLGIIGDGPDADRLQDLANTSEAAGRIEFLGFLDEYTEVIAHMRSADIFASPSIREGFGITLLEAMAADCTVITVDHENSAGSEVIGDAGFAVEPETASVAAILQEALNGKRPAVSPTDRAANYDWERITDRTESFYRDIITDS